MQTLPNPLGGERRWYTWRGWRVAYVVRGQGAPVVFVHSIHAAAWSAEWRRTLPALEAQHCCYALDLLGFGASDRPPLHYSSGLYLELIHDFLRDVVGEPATLVGSSLGGTYAVAVGHRHPELVRGVCAIGPAGVTRLVKQGGAPFNLIETLFRAPLVGAALFKALVSRPSIRFFLKDIYAFGLDAESEQLYWQAANQRNARFAPAAFVGMQLNRDIREAISAIPGPLLLVWGTKASQTPYREAPPVLALAPAADFHPIEAGDLPHEERADEFNSVLLEWMDSTVMAVHTA
jgi:pimeloyl-ACP methyl ester carboxylesterase